MNALPHSRLAKQASGAGNIPTENPKGNALSWRDVLAAAPPGMQNASKREAIDRMLRARAAS